MTVKTYMLYKTFDPITGCYYIGVHATRKPYLDGYQGSGDWVKICLETNVHLITGILEFFDTEAEAYTKEAELVTWEKSSTTPS
jgi:hypothetical protein